MTIALAARQQSALSNVELERGGGQGSKVVALMDVALGSADEPCVSVVD